MRLFRLLMIPLIVASASGVVMAQEDSIEAKAIEKIELLGEGKKALPGLQIGN
jgi:hypothetical protein